MINGVINIYKEQGYTSFDVVAKLRGIFRQKKIGHTGTLDPMAEGVLLVCLGNATKLVDMITAKDKCYKATMLLGKVTDTEDITGAVLDRREINATESEVKECILSFVGTYNQIPPMYSAIKKEGKKLYEYARAGIEVEREPRPVCIYSIDDIAIKLPYVSFTVHCSKGTYIRSLCRDMGEAIGCGATLSALVREDVHGYTAESALKLDRVRELVDKGEIMDYIMPVDSLLNRYNAYKVRKEYTKYLYNGNKLYNNQFENQPVDDIIRVYDDDKLIAVYKKTEENGLYKPYKMFLDS